MAAPVAARFAVLTHDLGKAETPLDCRRDTSVTKRSAHG